MTSPPTTPDVRLDKVEYARQLLAETREEVARADAKASLLFGAFGVVSSAVAAILVTDDWSPFQLPNRVEWMWWIGAALASSALLLLGGAVIPRMTHVEQAGRLYYFGHIAEFDDFDKFRAEFDVASTNMWERMLDQIWVESRIAKRKYVLTRWSMIAFFSAVVLLAGATLGGHLVD
jgi:hypothetical protein